jgi:hypothetical protein
MNLAPNSVIMENKKKNLKIPLYNSYTTLAAVFHAS